MAKPIHVMIRVRDEATSTRFYQDAFGLNVADRLDFEGFTLIYLSNSDNSFELELTVNKDRKQPYDLGDGYGHIAFVVDDLDATHRRFSSAGYVPRDIVDFIHEGALLARFFFVQDPDGYQIEVMQRAGRYR